MAGPPLCLNTFMNIEHHNSCCYMSSFSPPPIQTKTSEKWTLCASKYITNDNRSSCSAGLCGRCSRSAGEPGESYWPEIIRAERERDSFPTCGSWLLTRSPTIVRTQKGNRDTRAKIERIKFIDPVRVRHHQLGDNISNPFLLKSFMIFLA